MRSQGNGYFVVTFRSTHEAVKFEKRTKELGISTRLIPIPRQISSNCGIAARFEGDELDVVRQAILKQRLEYEAIYRFIPNSPRSPFERLPDGIDAQE